jgi:hypothetical protein
MSDEQVSATLSRLRSECEICGAWAAFTGATEVIDGLTYAIVRCPNQDGEFAVWNRDTAPLLAAFVHAGAASGAPDAFRAACATLTGGVSAAIGALAAAPPAELPLFSIEDIDLPASAAVRWVELLLDWEGWRPVPARSLRVEEALATAVKYQSAEAGFAIADRVAEAEAADVLPRVEQRFGDVDHSVLLPALERAGAGSRTRDKVQFIRSIAERLCQVHSGAESEIRAAFALPTEPPPLGAREVEITGGVLSRAGLEFRWSTPLLTKADIDEAFGGSGEVLPRTGPGAPFVFAYPLTVAHAPARVTVFAHFTGIPSPEAPARNLHFRIDPL